MLGRPCISSTCLINSIKHEHSCKILYLFVFVITNNFSPFKSFGCEPSSTIHIYCVSREGSYKTVQMHRLVGVFTCCLADFFLLVYLGGKIQI